MREKYKFLRKKKQLIDLEEQQELIDQKELDFEDILAQDVNTIIIYYN